MYKTPTVGQTMQQTQSIGITFIQFWTNVEYVGPTLYTYYTNAILYFVFAGLKYPRPIFQSQASVIGI